MKEEAEIAAATEAETKYVALAEEATNLEAVRLKAKKGCGQEE